MSLNECKYKVIKFSRVTEKQRFHGTKMIISKFKSLGLFLDLLQHVTITWFKPDVLKILITQIQVTTHSPPI